MTTTSDLPLAGLKVLELHAIGPVPYAGSLLISLGAQIVRVSPPADPKLGVAMKPEFDVLNAGKTQLLLDMKSAEGMAKVHEQLAQSDVLMEGFRPGVLERLGLAPADLLKRYPKLVIGRLSGFGSRGELAPRAGHDITYLAMCGVLHAIGTGETPVPPLNVVADFGGGAMHLLLGVMAKLIQRGITGKGGVAETSILAGSVGLTPLFFGLTAAGRWNPAKRESNMLDGGVPFYRVYKTKDDRHVAIGAIEAKFYLELLDVLGLKGEVDPARQLDPSTYAATIARFSERIATKTRDEWAALALPRDACMAPVLDFLEAAKYAHNLDNDLYTDKPFPKPLRTIEFDRGL